jgi:NADPH-dependent glutamate synthase beta subunit-like oxidoreductase/Pyruvate/2-oxoacid:ferredoxin oxidoreductase delta subunit
MNRITPKYRPKQVEKTAPCQVGCANCGDIRGWIGTVAQRNKTGISTAEAFARAWSVITAVNPFPATLGRICPHPCENHCNRSELDEPLAINAMERFLGDFGIRENVPLPRLAPVDSDEWLGVIGAGPSGLSFAYQMARRGYKVTIYDAREKAGGMLRYGVPDYRLPQEVLDAEIQKILDLGVWLELNTRVGRDISLEALRSRHSTLYLAIGAQASRGLDIPGAEGDSVWTGVDYLEQVNRGIKVETGEHAIVTGGGNTAIDAARCARRTGSDVTILYRRSRDEMPAFAHEIDDALEEGVNLELLATPVSVERSSDGSLKAVRVQRMKLGAPDSSGRRRPEPEPGSEFRLPATSVIFAVSQYPELEGMEALTGNGGDLGLMEKDSGDNDVIAGGDILRMGIAGEAIVQGRRAAENVHMQLIGDPEAVVKDPESADVTSERIRFRSKPGTEAVHADRLAGEERTRLGMAEVEQSVSEEQFLAEVDRCFSCGSCFGCEQCFMYCTAGCFIREDDPVPGHYFTLNLENCHECGKCIEVCPCGFLEIS